MSDLAKEVTVEVLAAGYVLLVLGLAWLLATRKTRRQSWDGGYQCGLRRGEQVGYERYAQECADAMPEGRRAAMRAARTRHVLTPRADWGEYSGATHLDPPPD